LTREVELGTPALAQRETAEAASRLQRTAEVEDVVKQQITAYMRQWAEEHMAAHVALQHAMSRADRLQRAWSHATARVTPPPPPSCAWSFHERVTHTSPMGTP